MTISIARYVDITSQVGGTPIVRSRELIGRLFSSNLLIPSQTTLEFDTLTEVGDYFSTSSDEYKRALFYFTRVSKTFNKPKKISFSRWVKTNQAPMIFGAKLTADLATLKTITDGSFTLTIGSDSTELTAITFAAAVTLADVATALQAKIQAYTTGGAQWTAGTVSYDATRGSFNFVGGDAATPAIISVAPGVTGTDISSIIGWYPHTIMGAVWSDGILTQSITDLLTDSTNISNNFGSFLFIDTLTDEEVLEAATWNDLQNNSFMYVTRITDKTDAVNKNAALAELSGCAMTYAPVSTEYDEQAPMMILAATNYTNRNSVQNYMFQQFPTLTPKVTTDEDADYFDTLRVNYYGATQTAGQQLAFYQTGVLTGTINDAVDMNVYANEQWLKDAATVEIMNLFLMLSRISADAQGRAQILNALQNVINQGLLNGTISATGTLTREQKAIIKEITNDDYAWPKVQDFGYWVDVEIISETTPSNSIIYVAQYTLVYKKNDVIRKVEGQHDLI